MRRILHNFLFFILIIFLHPSSLSSSNFSGFLENNGQIVDQHQNPRHDVRYYFQNQNFTWYLSDQGMHYSFSKPSDDDTTKIDIERIDVFFKGANLNYKISPSQLSSSHNFYNLDFHENGLVNVPSYKVLYLEDVYSGIDIRFTIKDSSLKYDIIVSPNGDLSEVKFQYGTLNNDIKLVDNQLSLSGKSGSIVEHIPYSYLLSNDSDTQYVDVNYDLKENGIVQFQTNADLAGKQLVVDPVLNWATYYGGSGSDHARGLYVDNEDNMYISGQTSSSFGIATTGAHQTTIGGSSDAFVAKFDPEGNRIWGSYFGGSSSERSDGVTVDDNKNVYVAGRTQSNNGIATTGAHQTSRSGVQDAFLVKFNPNGIRQWGTYYGGTGDDRGNGVAYDYNGNIILVGHARSTNGIASPGAYQTTFGGGWADLFIVKFDTSGNRQWATYYGGNGYDDARDVAADANGYIYVGGRAESSGLATTGAHQTSPGFGDNGILVKFAPNGMPEWATYYGGNGTDRGRAVAVDHNQNAYLTGVTSSNSSIASTGANQTTIGGGDDGFLVKFNSSGTRQWGTYIGGSQYDETFGVVADSCENVYVTGASESTNNIAMGNVHQSTLTGTRDAILLKFDASGQQKWGTYLGGSGVETGWAPGFNSNGEVIVAGWTNSSTGIATPGAHQFSFGGNQDAFVANFQCMPGEISLLQGNLSSCEGDTVILELDNYPSTASVQWYRNDQPIPGEVGTSLHATDSGSYKAYVDYSVCCKFYTNEIHVNFFENPQISLPQDATICNSDTFQIFASVTDGEAPYTFNWSPVNSLSDNSVLQPNAFPQQNTKYSLHVTDDNGCITEDSFNVLISIPPQVNAGNDTTICQNSFAQLNASGSENYLWEHTPMSAFSDTTIPNPIFTPHLAFAPINYLIQVTGLDSIGCSTKDSLVVLTKPANEITPPVSLCLQTANNGENVLTWDMPSDTSQLISYQVYRKSGFNGTFDSITQIPKNATQWTDNTITDGDIALYQYYITTYSDCNIESMPSDTASNLVLNFDQIKLDSIELKWHSLPNFTDYYLVEIDSGYGNGFEVLTTTTDTSYLTGSLLCSFNVDYRINTQNGCYTSTFVHLSFEDTIPPSKPTIQKATYNSTNQPEVHIISNPLGKTVKYNIYRSNDGVIYNLNDSVVAQTESTIWTDLSPEPGQNCYKTEAIDSCGNLSELSDQHCLFYLEGTNGNLSANLFWNNYQGFDYDSVFVQVKDNGSWQNIAIQEPGDSVLLVEDLLCNVPYQFRLSTFNNIESDDTVNSNILAITPFDTVPPEPPEVHYATIDNQGVNLSWTLSTSNDVNRYVIHRKEVGGAFTAIDTIGLDSAYIDNTIDPSAETYCYAVQAIDSCADNVSALSVTHCPVKLTSLIEGCVQETYLNWTPYSGWDVDQYVIYRSENGGSFEPYDSVSSGQTVFTDLNVSFPNTYCYFIETHQISGNFTSVSNTECSEPYMPKAPKVEYVSKANTETTTGRTELSWEIAEDSAASAYYLLYYKDNSSLSVLDTLPVTQTFYEHNGLDTRNENHSYFLTTVDTCGNESFPSDTHKTMRIEVSIGQLQHNVNWTQYKGFDNFYYLVERFEGGSYTILDTTNDTSFVSYPAPCNVPLFYRVSAVSDNNFISYSDTSGRVAIDSIPPDPSEMINLSVESGNEVHLSFIGSEALDIWSFFVERDPSAIWPDSVASFHFNQPEDSFYVIDDVYDFLVQGCYYVRAVDSCLNDALTPKFCHIKINGEPQNLQNEIFWHGFKGYTIETYVIQKSNGFQWESLDSIPGTDTFYVHSGLPCNVSEIYRIVGIEDGGSRITYSDTISLTPFDTTSPSAPEIRYVSHPDNSTIEVEWALSEPKVKKYEIQLQEDGGNWNIVDTVIQDSQYVISDITAQPHRYCVRIVAIDSCAANRSIPSEPHCVTDLTGIEANLSNILNWTDYNGFFSGAEYEVQRLNNGIWEPIDTVVEGTETYKDESLPCNIEEKYRLKTIESSTGYISFSNTVSLTPFDTTSPSAPEIRYISHPDNSTIEVEWALSEPKVKKYEIQLQEDGGNWNIVDTVSQDSQYVISGITAQSHRYCARIVAIDSCAANRSIPSEPHCVTDLTGIEANLSNILNWTDYNGFFSGAEYEVQRFNNGIWEPIDTVVEGTETYKDEPLPCNIEEEYRLKTIESSTGYFSFSNTISLTPFDTITPTKPVIDVATVDNPGTISIQWQLSDPKVEMYEIQISTKENNWTVVDTTGVQQFYTFNGLSTSDSTYCFRVVAIDSCSANRSLPSIEHCVVKLEGSEQNLANYLYWDNYEGFQSIQLLLVEVNQPSGWIAIDTLNTNSSDFIDAPLACDISQEYRIATYDGNFWSHSNVIELTPFDTLPPPQPQTQYVSVEENGDITIEWDKQSGSDAKYFEIWRVYEGVHTLIDTVEYDEIYIDQSTNFENYAYSYYLYAIDSCIGNNRSIASDTFRIISTDSWSGGCVPRIGIDWTPYIGFNSWEYRIWRSENEGNYDLIETISSNNLFYVDSTVTEGSTYCYRIEAFDLENGYSGNSFEVCDTPFVYPFPEAANLNFVTVWDDADSMATVKLNWERSSFADTFARGYRLYHAELNPQNFTMLHEAHDLDDTLYRHSSVDATVRNYYHVEIFNLCDEVGMTSSIHRPVRLGVNNNNLESELSWDIYVGKNIEYYEVYRSSNNSPYRLLENTTDTSYSDTMLSCENIYSYRIDAIDDEGNRVHSNTETVIAYDTLPPERPEFSISSVVSTWNNGKISLNFYGARDRNRNAYLIYRAIQDDNFNLIDTFYTTSLGNMYFHDSLSEDIESGFSYYIVSLDSCGNTSHPSDTHRTIFLQVEASSGQNMLNWESYQGIEDLNYFIERSGLSGNWSVIANLNENANEYIDNKVRCDSIYFYRIRAVTADGQLTTFSNIDSAKGFFDAPSHPTEINYVTVGQTGTDNGKIDIHWLYNDSIYYYNIYRSLDGTEWEKLDENLKIARYTDSLINTLAESYFYKIEGIDSCLNVSELSEMHGNIVLTTLPGEESALLNWQSYTGWEVDNYIIERDGNVIDSVSGEQRMYRDDDLLCTQTYQYRVGAIGHEGFISWSNASEVVPEDNTPPSAPYFEFASVSTPNIEVALSWDHPGDIDVSHYKLYRSRVGSSIMDELAVAQGEFNTEYTDLHADSIEDVFCYQVRAVDLCGNISDFSNRGCIILPTGTASGLQNTISWNPYIHWHDSVDQYIIHKSEDNAPYTVAGQTNENTLSFTDTLLGDNIENYCYRVEAREAGGDGVSFSTEYCLKQPANVFIPNAFSPYMSPGLNDTFGPEGMFITEFTMNIYNRWGQMIYETHNSEPWDGKLNNSYVESGAYIYQITITGYNGDKETYKGTVTITE